MYEHSLYFVKRTKNKIPKPGIWLEVKKKLINLMLQEAKNKCHTEKLKIYLWPRKTEM